MIVQKTNDDWCMFCHKKAARVINEHMPFCDFHLVEYLDAIRASDETKERIKNMVTVLEWIQ